MPFASDAQRGYLYAKKPDVAKKFEKHSSPAEGALKSMKDFISGRYGNKKEKERLPKPEGFLGSRG